MSSQMVTKTLALWLAGIFAAMALFDFLAIGIFGTFPPAILRDILRRVGVDSSIRALVATMSLDWAEWLGAFIFSSLCGFRTAGRVSWAIPAMAVLVYTLVSLNGTVTLMRAFSSPSMYVGVWLGSMLSITFAYMGWCLGAKFADRRLPSDSIGTRQIS